MKTVIITGSGGLIGSESAKQFHAEGYRVVGIDNDMRSYFFGDEASTRSTSEELRDGLEEFHHHEVDIRQQDAVERVFNEYGADVAAVIHTAAQPSHDWAAKEPLTDFSVNALGTMHLLEATRQHCPEAAFVFTSTNKVYGDSPNELPLVEQSTRWELDSSHEWHEHGIPETLSIDHSKHSIFGASKVAADVMVQEYGRYFGMNTVCFRGGCLTGPAHAGAELHGFLAFLMRCVATGRPYRVFGYKGKQVRDNIHCTDLVNAFRAYVERPRPGEVYNIGGGRMSNCSMLEAIAICEDITGKKLEYTLLDDNRIGDHIWYVSDTRKFQEHYPSWTQRYSVREILEEIAAAIS